MKSIIRVIGVGLASFALFAMACTNTVPTPSVMYIVNESGRRIAKLDYVPCGSEGTGRLEVNIGQGISVGQTKAVPILAGCVHLRALDAEARVIGEQRDLRMIPGTKWRISQ